MKCRKKTLLFVLCFVYLFFVAGCDEAYDADYELGIIQTQEYKEESKICFYDEQLQLKKEIKYPYPNISYDGFFNSLIKNNKLYLQPKGHSDELDYGKIIAMSLQDGEVTEYDFNRTNITAFDCDEQKVYAVSNLNGITYIDCYDIKTKEMQTFETDKILIDNIAVNNGKIYAMAMDWETEEDIFGCVSIEAQNWEEHYRIQTDMSPAFLEFFENRVYFVDKNLLYEYQTDAGKMVTHELPHTNAYNLSLKNEKLYIGCTDIFEETTSYLEVFDINSGENETLLTVDGSILQVEVFGENCDTIYLRGYENIEKYKMYNGGFRKEQELKLPDENDFFVGGFFVNSVK